MPSTAAVTVAIRAPPAVLGCRLPDFSVLTYPLPFTCYACLRQAERKYRLLANRQRLARIENGDRVDFFRGHSVRHVAHL